MTVETYVDVRKMCKEVEADAFSEKQNEESIQNLEKDSVDVVTIYK